MNVSHRGVTKSWLKQSLASAAAPSAALLPPYQRHPLHWHVTALIKRRPDAGHLDPLLNELIDHTLGPNTGPGLNSPWDQD